MGRTGRGGGGEEEQGVGRREIFGLIWRLGYDRFEECFFALERVDILILSGFVWFAGG